MEFRTAVESTIRDADTGRREVLLEFPHEKTDTFKTTFSPDAFRASFAEGLPVMCWQHQTTEPIGRIASAQVTGRANEMVGKLSDFDAVPLARRAYSQIEDGSLTGVSFGFERQADERHPERRGVTRITKAKMREVSPVTFASIPGALATGVRQEVPEVEIRNIIELVEHKVVAPEQAQAMLRAAGIEIPEGRARDFARDPAREKPPMGPGSVGAADVRPGMVVVAPNESPSLVNAIHMPSPEVVEIHYQGQASAVSYHPKTQLQILDPANPLVPGVGGMSATQAAKHTMGNSQRSDDGDAGELAAAVDAALDEAERLFSGSDTRSLPEPVQQAAALVSAAGAAVDDLLEVMGVPDADASPAEARSGPSAADLLPDADAVNKAKEQLDGLPESLRAHMAEMIEAREAELAGETRRNISQKDREDIAEADCAGKGKSFPIDEPGDVEAAASSIGRAGPDNHDPATIKANIIRIAKRKGSAYVAKLPDSWKAEDAKREARARASLERRAS